MLFLHMKTLLLIRHAKSSWETTAVKDFDRPLNDRGLRNAGEMARRLHLKIETIDAFISSPAVRANTTALLFLPAFKKPSGHLLVRQQLYLAPAAVFEQFVSEMDDAWHSAAVFAHNPGITDYANSLTRVVVDNIPTCGIFAVRAQIDQWNQFAGAEKEFLFFDYPKLVG